MGEAGIISVIQSCTYFIRLFSDRLLFSALQADAFRGQRLSLLGNITLRGLRRLLFPQESRPFATKLKLVKATIFTK
ncbi:hypothetical protein CR205_09195 [Alteribacter lacisalsi]|uniref:Uncharacterized protein n=1 Tax=Alteribacter lacisalsi TaxID=2045244 RepID=A0A2W0HCZ3_9BACI|nr:hypothetical protein CR205_09195 [Alteribacter lacisalsi]